MLTKKWLNTRENEEKEGLGRLATTQPRQKPKSPRIRALRARQGKYSQRRGIMRLSLCPRPPAGSNYLKAFISLFRTSLSSLVFRFVTVTYHDGYLHYALVGYA